MATKKTREEARKQRHQRIRGKIYGTPQKPRLNVFRSLNEIYAQVIDDLNGNTLTSASTIDTKLRSEMDGLSKKEQARLVGQAIAKRAQEKGIDEVVFDRGGYKYMGRIAELASAARESGLKF